MMIALLGFFFAIEQMLPYNTRHVFSLVDGAIIVATVLAPFEFMTALALAASIVVFISLVLFLLYFVKNTAGR